jgi:hypothetical protein
MHNWLVLGAKIIQLFEKDTISALIFLST